MTRPSLFPGMLIPAAVFASLACHAQPAPPDFRRPEVQHFDQRWMPGVPGQPGGAGLESGESTASKTSAMASRLIIQGVMSGTAANRTRHSDSTTYGYTGRLRNANGTFPVDTFTNYTFDSLGNHRENTRTINEDFRAGKWTRTTYLQNRGAGLKSRSRTTLLLDVNSQDSTYSSDTTDPAGVYHHNTRLRYQYAGARPDLLWYVFAQWNEDSLDYISSYRYDYTYDASGNVLTNQFARNTGGILTPLNRRTNTYNASGKIDEALIESYVAGAWQLRGHVRYTYDAALNPVREETESLQSGSVVGITRRDWAYDAAGHQTASTNTRWAPAAGWTNTDRTTYTYDAGGFQSGVKYQRGAGVNWVNVDSTAIVNNSSGEAITTIDNIWNAGRSQWVPQYRRTYAYHTPSLVSSIILERFDTLSASFSNSELEGARFNLYDQPAFYYKMLWDGMNWAYGVGATAMTYYYEEFDHGLNAATGSSMQRLPLAISPVPAVHGLSVSIPFSGRYSLRGRISDLSGRVCRQWQCSGEGPYRSDVDVRDLPEGNYILTIDTASGSESRMVSVAR